MKKFKIFIEILLLLDTILLLSIEKSGRLLHEIFGIAMAILLLIHIILNWNWIKNTTKNLKKENIKTKLMYLVNILMMIIYFGAIIFGIIVSNELFQFETAGNYKLILTHIIFGRLAIIIMLVHIGMHFKKEKNKRLRNIIYVIYIVIAILLSMHSIYLLTHDFWWMMTFGGSFLSGV